MHTLISDAIAAALAEIVGAHACLRGESETIAFTTDYRGIFKGKAAAVVMPATTDELSRVMAWCHNHDVPVVPQGGNTSLMGGAVPDGSGQAVVVNLRRMNRVLEIDATNDTMTVEAGVTLQAVRAAAEAAGRLFPLRIGSEGSCQIGGNLSTNLGVEAVLPDGRIYSGLRGLRKDNTGYDLKQLFIGSEGTLGIITAAVLKLMPLPRSSAVAFVAIADPAAAVALLAEAKRIAGQAVTAFELVSEPALELVLAYLGSIKSPFEASYDWMVLLELTSGADAGTLDQTLMQILEAGLESGLVIDASVAASGADAQTFWRIREEISDAQTRTGGSIKCDVSVPLSRIASFIDGATAAVFEIEPRARMVIYGHMGDGNVHFNPLRPEDCLASDFIAACYEPVSHAVDALAHAAGGSISAEHGIGVAKRDDLAFYKSAVELDLMWQVKLALDPKNLLNPAKVLPLRP